MGLSYRGWKQFMESIEYLGVRSPTNLGIISNFHQGVPETEACKCDDDKKVEDEDDDEEMDDEEMGDEEDVDDGEEVDGEEDADTGDGEVIDDEEAPPKDQPEEKIKKMIKVIKKESAEEEFWADLRQQMARPKQIDFGFKEDWIIPPDDPNEDLVVEKPEEAQPGEPGFAPQTRIGEMPSFAEWAEAKRGLRPE